MPPLDSANPFADLIPEGGEGASGVNPFADLIPDADLEAKKQAAIGNAFARSRREAESMPDLTPEQRAEEQAIITETFGNPAFAEGDEAEFAAPVVETPKPKAEDSWAALGRKVIENAPTMFKQQAGGAVQAIAELPPSPPPGIDPNDPMWQGVVAAHRERIGKGGLDTLGRKIYDAATADLKANAPNVDPESLKDYAYDIAQAVIQMGPTIAASLATRSAAPGLALMGAQMGGQKYGESRAEGRTPEQATADAAFFAAAETIPETLPLGILMKPGGKFLSRVLKTGAAEAVQEMFTEALEAGYDAGILDKDMTWGEALGRIKRAGIVGGAMGGTLAAATQPFARGAEPPADVPPGATPAEQVIGPDPFADLIPAAQPATDTQLATQPSPTPAAEAARPEPTEAAGNLFSDLIPEQETPADDTQGRQPVRGAVEEGEESRRVEDEGGGAEAASAGRVFQAPEIRERDVEALNPETPEAPVVSSATVEPGVGPAVQSQSPPAAPFPTLAVEGRQLVTSAHPDWRAFAIEHGQDAATELASAQFMGETDITLPEILRRAEEARARRAQDRAEQGIAAPRQEPTTRSAQRPADSGPLSDNTLGAVTAAIYDSPGYLNPTGGNIRVLMTPREVAEIRAAGFDVADDGSMSFETAQLLLDERTRRTSGRERAQPAAPDTVSAAAQTAQPSPTEAETAAAPRSLDQILPAVRRIVADRKKALSVRSVSKLAVIEPKEARRALDRLAAQGVIRKHPKSGAYTRKPKRGPRDVLQFIAEQGGIRDEGGEMRAMDAHRKLVPGFGPLVRPTGKSIDDMGEALHEAGYFGAPETRQNVEGTGAERPSVSEVIDLIRRAVGGEKIYSDFDRAEVEEREAKKAEADQRQAERRASEELDAANETVGIEIGEDDRRQAIAEIMDGRDPEDVLGDIAERQAVKWESDADAERTENAPAGEGEEAPPFGEPAGVEARDEETRAETGERADQARPADEGEGQGEEVAPSGGYTLKDHTATIKNLRAGELSADEVRAAFNRLLASEDAIKAELNERTLRQLAPGGTRGMTKAQIIGRIFDNMLQSHIVGSFQWNPMSEKPRQAYQRVVREQTDEKIQEAVGKARERAAARQKALTDPETLSEFMDYFESGKKLEDLSPEKQRLYDELTAARRREIEAKRREQEGVIKAADIGDAEMTLVETKHTQKGHDLFVVRLSKRIDADRYKDLNAKAKKLGGYYSSYAKGGAVPGFQFKTRDAAEKFMALKEGDVSRVDQMQAREEEVKGNVVERLRAMAERMDESADERLSADRKVNTERRARMAAGAEAAARADKAMAATMRNLADAIADGNVRHLDGIRSRADIETLDRMLRRAKHEWVLAQRDAGQGNYERLSEQPITDEMVIKARYPYPYAHRDNAKEIAQAVENKAGFKRMGAALRKAAEDAERRGDWRIVGDSLGTREMLEVTAKEAEKDSRAKYTASMVLESFKDFERLQRMGLREPATLRAALREFLEYRGKESKADPVKAAERALIGRKIPGYFPTPEKIVDEMIEKADIGPGMSVLEPSAGKGNIADKARAVADEGAVSVIEPVTDLRTILAAKGHNIVGNDFLDHDTQYNRIVMNPPFEDRQDVAHVMHAYGLLKPGGRVVAIMSEGPFFGSDARAVEFRDWLDRVDGVSEKLPEGSFRDSERSTGVATRMVVIDKPGQRETIDRTDQGEQRVLPGAERSARQAAESREAEGKGRIRKGGNESLRDQKGGLFGSDRDQEELFSLRRGGSASHPPGTTIVTERLTRGGGEIHFHYSDAFEAEREQVKAAIRQLLNRLGLGDIAVRVADRIDAVIDGKSFEVDGRYFRAIIDIALDSRDRTAVAWHEALHAMRALGLFTKAEWSLLMSAAKSMWRKRFRIDSRYPGLSEAELNEEAAADALAAFARGDFNVGGRVLRILNKALRILRAIGNALRGRGFQTWEDVFERIDRGEVGRRERREIDRAETPAFSLRRPKTEAEKRQVATEVTSFRDRLWDALDRTAFSRLEALGSLPGRGRYLAERYIALGEVSKIDKAAHDIAALFRKASASDKKATYDYLTTKDAKPDGIADKAVRDLAVKAKDAIDRQGKALVERGLLSEEAFEKNRGSYLPRVYLKYLLDSPTMGLGVRPRPSEMAYLKRRKDIPVEVRDIILGEIKDPGYLASRAIAIPARDMALLDFLSKIAKNKDWIYPRGMVEWRGRQVTGYYLEAEAKRLRAQVQHFPEENRQRVLEMAARMEEAARPATEHDPGDVADFKQIPNVRRYGELRGMFVRKEIYDDVMGARALGQSDGSIAEQILGYGGALTKATQFWKMSKVALNPPSQVRNFVSNGVLLHLSGVPFLKVPSRVIAAVREMRNNGPHWQVAKKYGVTAASFASNELPRIERDLLALKSDGGPVSWLRGAGARLTNVAGDTYQLSESVFKTAKIIDAMEREGLSAEKAALEAHKWLYDYSLVPRSVRYLRNAPFGIPFLTFLYKTLPRMIEVAVKRPWAFAPYVVVPYILYGLLAAQNDVEPDDVKKLLKALPNWLQDRGSVWLLPMRDRNGNWQPIDMGYFLPWSTLTDVAGKLGKGDVGGALTTVGVMGSPVADILTAIQTNKDPFFDKDIINKNDPPAKQVADLMLYIWRLAMPSWLTDQGAVAKLWGAMRGETTATGEPGLTVPQALGRFVGINVYPIDPEESRDRNIRRMAFAIDEAKRRARYRARDARLSDAERERLIEQADKYVQTLEQQLERYERESEVHPNLRRKQVAE